MQKQQKSVGFIAHVMEYINHDLSELYGRYYNIAMQMPIQQLRQYVMENTHVKYFNHDLYNLNQLPTSGCRHHINEGRVCGCSMCNLSDQSYATYASMRALSERDRNIYIDVIRLLSKKARGEVHNLSLHEFIFAYDTLDINELPHEVLSFFLGEEQFFRRRPLSYELETRVDSINEENLKRLKRHVGNRPVWLRFGIETSDEIVRNIWLNKNLTNNQIQDAIQLCKEYDIYLSANILLGMPGITEAFSLQSAQHTIQWLLDLNVDQIIVNVLSRADHTLQHFIWKSLNDTHLNEYGICQGDHTGVPWLFTCLKLLEWIKENYRMDNKISFGQFQSDYLQKACTTAYNYTPNCSCNQAITSMLNNFAFHSEWTLPNKLYGLCTDENCYKEYINILEKQSKILTIHMNMSLIAKEIADKVKWETAQSDYEEFSAITNDEPI